VDELLLPDPVKYPLGLKGYLDNFLLQSQSQQSGECFCVRAQGHTLAHVSESFDGHSSPLEVPLDWSLPLLQQRRHWVRSERYDKPLLTAHCIVHWKAGFHTALLPKSIVHDPSLHLLHLPEVDRDMCLQREQAKFLVYDRLGHAAMKGGGENGHIKEFTHNQASGTLCRLARAAADPTTGRVYDAKGTILIDKMGLEWANVTV
jgi:hypothetical protein